MAKMWAGRFSKEVDETVNAFNSSISFDGRMYAQDIRGSIAHATMLGDCGIIPQDDVQKIIAGLKGILADLHDFLIDVRDRFFPIDDLGDGDFEIARDIDDGMIMIVTASDARHANAVARRLESEAIGHILIEGKPALERRIFDIITILGRINIRRDARRDISLRILGHHAQSILAHFHIGMEADLLEVARSHKGAIAHLGDVGRHFEDFRIIGIEIDIKNGLFLII